ncbi:MAG: diguanylate cyclase [Endomicrobiia bacterium]
MENFQDKEIDELESEGYGIIDVIAGDVKPTQEMQYIIDKISEEKRGTFYSDILYNLTSERFPEKEAKELWQEILRHKYIVSEMLKRNIGIRVAALDYMENIKKIIQAPKIIEETEFRKALKLAETDPLTGVLNRRSFIRNLIQEIQNAEQRNQKFSIMMIDLDGFKNLNDREGHAAGDLILQEFTLLLKSNLRKQDIIGRYGGDEFIVLLPGTNKYETKKVAEKIRVAVEKEFNSVGITVSIGIAEYPSEGTQSNILISNADEALYRAKEFGKNKVVYFKPVEIKYKTEDPEVKQVSCVGDFNGWNRKIGEMVYSPENKEWIFNINLKPGVYRYKFLLNGTNWIADPGSVENVDDCFGGLCSILRVDLE